MTDAQQALAQVREALAAGPTPGPWSVETVPTSCGVCHKVGPFPGKRPDDPPRHACLYADYPSAGNPADDELMANANFIAACNPEAIRELLAERDALKAENESLKHENHNLKWAIGTEGYEQMATPEEQAEHDKAVQAHNEFIARLEKGKTVYEELKADAERYRWLRNEANTARKCDPMVCIYPLDEQDLIDGDRLDVAIDAAMGLTRPAEE